ncbi:MAG: hypothetical protein II885_01510 [Oscillospiraceae bacterium]|nr:hypothetical protein [Oscillospiraceae bacterium]
MTEKTFSAASNDEAVLSFLRERGILADESITPQQVEEKKRKEAYHNTLLLLSNYRNILWQTDSELDTIAAELNLPLQKLDAVLSRIDAEIGMENRRLELRLERLAKTRQLLDRINDALTTLKYKPDNGPLLYDLIYLTYISEEKLHQTDVLYRLNISRRHYYRLKEQAINIISLRLWSVPSKNIDLWLDLVSMLSGKAKPSGS